MNEQKKQNLSWIEAELEETLDDLFESEFNEPMLSDELRGLYKEKHPNMLDRRTYYTNLLRLQAELIKLQHWVELTGAKVLILCEGRDSAGKGGVIKRITQRLNPRVARVVALPAPTEREKTQWYFQRYVPHLPAGGEVVIFDRSWYNRAGVERVMGFATEQQVDYFLKYAPAVERSIIHSGIILIKYWLEVDMDVQDERLRARDEDPRKIW